MKWDAELKRYLERDINKKFDESSIVKSTYRPFIKKYLYFDKHFNGRTFQLPQIFPIHHNDNKAIWIKSGVDAADFCIAIKHIPDVLTLRNWHIFIVGCCDTLRIFEHSNNLCSVTHQQTL
ncbi:MAG: type ISP restriction/modification enzyme [Cyanobacteria bacterium J06633_8]